MKDLPINLIKGEIVSSGYSPDPILPPKKKPVKNFTIPILKSPYKVFLVHKGLASGYNDIFISFLTAADDDYDDEDDDESLP